MPPDPAAGTWDNPDRPSMPWVGVADRDIRRDAHGLHPHFLPGLRTRVADDIHAALLDVPGITWTFEPET